MRAESLTIRPRRRLLVLGVLMAVMAVVCYRHCVRMWKSMRLRVR